MSDPAAAVPAAAPTQDASEYAADADHAIFSVPVMNFKTKAARLERIKQRGHHAPFALKPSPVHCEEADHAIDSVSVGEINPKTKAAHLERIKQRGHHVPVALKSSPAVKTCATPSTDSIDACAEYDSDDDPVGVLSLGKHSPVDPPLAPSRRKRVKQISRKRKLSNQLIANGHASSRPPETTPTPRKTVQFDLAYVCVIPSDHSQPLVQCGTREIKKDRGHAVGILSCPSDCEVCGQRARAISKCTNARCTQSVCSLRCAGFNSEEKLNSVGWRCRRHSSKDEVAHYCHQCCQLITDRTATDLMATIGCEACDGWFCQECKNVAALNKQYPLGWYCDACVE